jgi:RHS repeat-associated protein
VGDSTSYQYDGNGQQTLVIQGYGSSAAATTQYVYDANGNLSEEIDPDHNTTSYAYDGNGNQTLMVQAYGTTNAESTSYAYDGDGNLTGQLNPNGTSLSMTYDSRGDLLTKTLYAVGGGVTDVQSYSYDGDGNLLTAGNKAGTYTFGYDADNQQTLVVNPNGVTLNYQYDANGNVTQVTDSLGDTVASQYDADGNLTQRSYSGPNGAQLLVSLSYDGDNNLTGLNRYSDVAGTHLVGSASYAYDAQGNVTNIVHQNSSGSTLASFSYGYDAAGELKTKVENGSTTSYTYDAKGQLTAAGSTSYSYDTNGNPTQGGTNVIGPNNELQSDGTWSYSYDADGNLTGKVGISGGPDAGLTWAYSYDAEHELLSATETNSQKQTLVQETFVSDVFGNIVASSLSTNGGAPVVTHYVYSGSTLWSTTNASNVLQTFYLSGDRADQYIAQYDTSNGAAWYLTNNLGSVCTTVNNSGQPIDNIVYDAYGKVTSQSNAAQEPGIGYTGLQTFAALGLDKAGMRFYDPQSQQWLQQDSILLAAGPNTREYVNDEPTNATDPTGQWLTTDDNATSQWRSWVQEQDLRPFTKELPKDHWYNTSHPYGIVVSQYAFPLVRYMIDTASNDRYREVLQALINTGTQTAFRGNSGWGNTYVTLSDEQLHEIQQAQAQITSPQTYRRNEFVSNGFGMYAKAFAEGIGDGAIIVADQLTGEHIGSLHAASEQLIQENGGLYVYSKIAGQVAEQALEQVIFAGAGGMVLKGGSKLAAGAAKFAGKVGETAVGQVGKAMFRLLISEAGAARAACGIQTVAKAAATANQARMILNEIDTLVTQAEAAKKAYEEGDTPGMVKALANSGINGLNLASSVKDFAGTLKAIKEKGLWGFLKSCFAAGTPLRTPEGSKLIEQFQEGDRILSRSEFDPDGPLEVKVVEEVFVRTGRIMDLRVRGQVIRTTSEHPFWVRGKGWTEAGALQAGDLLPSHDGQWVAVEELRDTGEYAKVYNLRIADYHTYFVGDSSWGFSVWAHNSYTALREEGLDKSQAKRANMLYKTQGEAAARAYLEGQGFSGSRLDNLANAAARQRTGAQRGPNDTSGHTATIRRVASEVTANGDTVIGGGKAFDGVRRGEVEFATPGGFRDSRRPDILVQRPDGSIYGINVGQTEASGLPVLRERLAIQDLNEQRGLEMQFVSYGRRQ